MAKASGILSIAAGALFIIAVIIGGLFIWMVVEGFAVGLGGSTDGRLLLLLVLALPFLAIGTVAVFGGAAAIRRQNWGLALAGSICSLICLLVLGIPSLILVILSKHEFA